MDTTPVEDSSALFNDAFGLASWNRPRSSEELRAFITSHAERLSDDIEVE